eukprot:TRINITY_DN12059_c0_g2_i2.p2 TRINITY_DN12059_c0_g2~~TRINITY_DN12059_c0_g2_i2.p2  ORF type:complete len:150 (-),score=6.35 TRINITY_DN12059_c0_g2_i2:579-1028(-)
MDISNNSATLPKTWICSQIYYYYFFDQQTCNNIQDLLVNYIVYYFHSLFFSTYLQQAKCTKMKLENKLKQFLGEQIAKWLVKNYEEGKDCFSVCKLLQTFPRLKKQLNKLIPTQQVLNQCNISVNLRQATKGYIAAEQNQSCAKACASK